MKKFNIFIMVVVVLVEVIGMMLSIQSIAQNSLGNKSDIAPDKQQEEHGKVPNTRRAEIHIDKEIDGQRVEMDTTIAIDENLEIGDILDRLGPLYMGNSECESFDFLFPDNAPFDGKTGEDISPEVLGKHLFYHFDFPAPSTPGSRGCEPNGYLMPPPCGGQYFNHDDRAYMGVYVRDNDTADNPPSSNEENNARNKTTPYHMEGVYIDEVAGGGAADKAGLQKDDIIVTIDGQKIDTYAALREAIAKHKANDVIQVGYLRAEQKKTVAVVLQNAMQPPMPPNAGEETGVNGGGNNKPILGIICDDTYEEGGNEGVLINRALLGGGAEAAGLQRGDILLKIDDKPVNRAEELRQLISEHKIGDKVAVLYRRNGQEQTVNAELNESILPDMPYMRRHFFRLPPPQPNPNCPQNKEHFDMFAPDAEDVIEWEELLPDNPSNASPKRFKVAISIQDIDNNEVKQLSQNKKGDVQWSEKNTLAADDLRFFPNPNNGKFTVNFSLPEHEEVCVLISDPNGKEVFKDKIDNFDGHYERQIDLSHQAKGTYFLQITQKNKQLGKKIVIQ